jgi:hypothetical protein
MYITNMTHFLDESGNIVQEMPGEARELASFFTLVVDKATTVLPRRLPATDIRCFEKGCEGTTRIEIIRSSNEIRGMCSSET